MLYVYVCLRIASQYLSSCTCGSRCFVALICITAKYDDRGVLLPAPSQGEAGCGLDEKHEDADLDNSTNPFEFQRDVQGMRSGGTPTLQVQRHPSARVTERPPPLSVVSRKFSANRRVFYIFLSICSLYIQLQC